ncbi:MAG: ADP-ribosylation factor-like protein [Candidatus Hodarchaeota archaeon]
MTSKGKGAGTLHSGENRMKIALLGLDAAGKTSFVRTLQKKYSESIDLQPTKGIDRTRLRVLGKDVSLWDFGGQEAYRERYLRKEESLASVDLVLFLVDITDPARFDEAAGYFSSLIAQTDLGKVDQSRFVLCLHKSDPDRVMTDNAIIGNISLGSEKFREVIPTTQIFETSIFSPRTILSAISVGIQKTIQKQDIIDNMLEAFVEQTGSKAVHLLSSDAFSFGAYSLDSDSDTVCETLGFSFVEAWEAISSRGEDPKVIAMQLEKGWAFFNRVVLDKDNYLFLVTYASSEAAREPILQQIPAFTEKVSDIVRAISL